MTGLVQSTARGLHGTFGLLLLAGLLCCADAVLAQEVYEEDEVKAAFIYHFATFVKWPSVAEERDVFLIAVMGGDDVAEELERFLPGREIEGKPMQVLRLDSLDELDHADMLFIGADHNQGLAKLIPRVKDRPMLVVTDAPRGLDYGSTINFDIVDERVRFEISLPAARNAGLELSSRLLAAAMFVDTTSALPPRSAIILVSAPGPAGACRSGNEVLSAAQRRQLCQRGHRSIAVPSPA